jgi:hypothetical protein
MPNRSMQLKFERAKIERAKDMQDILMRESQRFTDGAAQSLADLVAAYKGPIHRATKRTHTRKVSDATMACTNACRYANLRRVNASK